jgi:hypothetical protein
MQSETMHSDSIDFSVSITEVDRLAGDSQQETPEHRQLCGISVYLAEFYIRVSIHTSSGTVSHSIPRNFPDKEIYIETDFSESMDSDDEIPLGNIQ